MRILIVDDNLEFMNRLSEIITATGDMDVCGAVDNGLDALEYIKKSEPDILLMDIIIPKLDGIAVLEAINDMENIKKPKVIIITAVGNERIIRHVMRLGTSYYYMKPFDMDSLIKRMREIFFENDMPNGETAIKAVPAYSGHERASHIDVETTKIIQEIGVPPHLLGYKYVRDAIVAVVKDPKLINAVTLKLYPLIAEKHNTTLTKVERAIRNAVETAWNKGRVDVINNYFGYTIDGNRGKPTNSEFIAMISDRIRIRHR